MRFPMMFGNSYEGVTWPTKCWDPQFENYWLRIMEIPTLIRTLFYPLWLFRSWHILQHLVHHLSYPSTFPIRNFNLFRKKNRESFIRDLTLTHQFHLKLMSMCYEYGPISGKTGKGKDKRWSSYKVWGVN